MAEIVRRLDGLPLAIELAAARVRILTPSAMVTRLDDRLGLLSAGGRDLPERQRTLRGAIDWSHDLLDADSRRLFARLSVFQGGGTFATAEAVCGADDAGTPDLDVLAGIEMLAEQSLIRILDDPHGDGRFVMLETIREYAAERLAEAGEPVVNAFRHRHAAAYLELAQAAAATLSSADRGARPRPSRGRPRQPPGGARPCDRRPPTASRRRASCVPCSASGTCAATSWRAAPAPMPSSRCRPGPLARRSRGCVRSRWRAGSRTGRATSRPPPATTRRPSERHGPSATRRRSPTRSTTAASRHPPPRRVEEWSRAVAYAGLRLAHEALEINERLGDAGGIARCLWAVGLGFLYGEDLVAALPALTRAVDAFEPLDDAFGLAWARFTRGVTNDSLGDPRAAITDYALAFAAFEEADDLSGLTLVQGAFSGTLLGLDRTADAYLAAGVASRWAAETGTHLATIAPSRVFRLPDAGHDRSRAAGGVRRGRGDAPRGRPAAAGRDARELAAEGSARA